QDMLTWSLTASRSPRIDESKDQRAVLNLHPLENHAFDIDGVPDGFDHLGNYAQPALIDGQRWLTDSWAKLATLRAPRACLTGAGGDGLFGQMFPPLVLGDHLRRLHLREWRREFWSWVGSGRYSM